MRIESNIMSNKPMQGSTGIRYNVGNFLSRGLVVATQHQALEHPLRGQMRGRATECRATKCSAEY